MEKFNFKLIYNQLEELKKTIDRHEQEIKIKNDTIEDLVQSAVDYEIALFISENRIYENNHEGELLRQNWYDGLSNDYKYIFGIAKISETTEILKNIINLTKIKINFRTEDISSLKYLTKLKTLELESLHGYDEVGNSLFLVSSTAIDIKPITYLAKLEELSMIHICVKDIEQLKKLHKLRKVKISNVITKDEEGFLGLNKICFSYNAKLEEICVPNSNLHFMPETNYPRYLKKLNLSMNQIISIDEIYFFYNLEYLNLSHNSNIEDFSAIKRLSYLNYLNLSHTNIDNLNDIIEEYTFYNLLTLDISNTKIENINPITCWCRIEYLNISHCNITDLSCLKKLSRLKCLNISKLGLVENLRSLISLSNLTELIMNDNDIKDIESIYLLSKLKKLSVKGCNLSQLEITKIKSSLPNCEISF